MTASPPSRTQFLCGIQALRGIFAVLVVCHHIGVRSARLWSHDWLGGWFYHNTFRIDFFFVLSGFVLWASHSGDAGRPAAARSFLLRRGLRLYPLLMTMTLFKVLLITCFPGRSSDSYQIIPSLLAFPQSSFPVIVSAWTLSFEMYFMIILAACLALPAKAALPALVLVAGLLPVGGMLFDVHPAIHGLGFLTHPFILEFAAGAVAAECVRQRGSRGGGMLLCSVAIVGLVLGSTEHLRLNSIAVIWQKSIWAVIFAVGLGGMALLERSCRPERWWLQDYWSLGRASYSIFLSHGFVLMVGFAMGKPQMCGGDPFWTDVFLLLLVILALLFGLVVYKYWERPLLSFCKSLVVNFPSRLAGSDSSQTPQV